MFIVAKLEVVCVVVFDMLIFLCVYKFGVRLCIYWFFRVCFSVIWVVVVFFSWLLELMFKKDNVGNFIVIVM